MRELVYDFFKQNGYVFELVLSVHLFTYWMHRRRYFWLRLAGCAAALLAVSMLWQLLPVDNVVVRSLRTVLFFALVIPCVQLCYRVRTNTAIFYITAACASQHVAYKAARSTVSLVWMSHPGLLQMPGVDLLYAVLFVVYLVLCAAVFGRALRSHRSQAALAGAAVLPLLVGMQLTTNLFQNILDVYSLAMGPGGYTALNLFAIVSCLFLLCLQYEITKTSSSQQDNAILKQLLYQQKQQMEMSRETVELINIKCHDIKNQIATLGSRIPAEEIAELNRAITIYDTTLRTGCEPLDLLLGQKALLCEKKGIRFDCAADGKALDFLKPADIYSLLGNALDNAIEAAGQVADPERRCIHLRAARQGNMVSVCVENLYDGSVTFEDGLPQTSKADKRYHGFGMKSIRMIVEKYQGALDVQARDGTFALSILLPVPG